MHSVNALSQHEGVVVTHEAHTREIPTTRGKMINQYEFGHKVGKGQHGEVFLSKDTTLDNMDVVSHTPPVSAPSAPSPLLPHTHLHARLVTLPPLRLSKLSLASPRVTV